MMPVGLGGNLLNRINEHGLLTYTDYHFLLLLLSTPTRYLDIIFHGFDIILMVQLTPRSLSTSWLGLLE